MEEKRDSIPRLLALRAPRPRERTGGSDVGGRGPTMASSGSESEDGGFDRRLLLRDGLELRDIRLGERERERERNSFLCSLRRGDLERDRDNDLEYDLLIL